MKKLLIAILLALIAISPLTYTYQTHAQESSVTERNQRQLMDLLKLVLPNQTDNPNYLIKFENPADDETPVRLTIDGQNEQEISSPFTLPSLATGSHSLLFKFKDGDGTNRELERTLVVIPRAPTISPAKEITQEGKLKVSGTAVGAADVLLFLATPLEAIQGVATSEVDGDWTYEFEGTFNPGVYTLTAQTQKSGLKSDFANPITFTLSNESDDASKSIQNQEDIIATNFVLKEMQDPEKAVKIFRDNPDLVLFTSVAAVLGAILAVLFVSFTRGIKDRSKAKSLSNAFSSKRPIQPTESEDKVGRIETTQTAPISLREKFENAGINFNRTGQSTEKSKPAADKIKQEKIINNQINEINSDLLVEQVKPNIEASPFELASKPQKKKAKKKSSNSETITNQNPTSDKPATVKPKKNGKTMSKEEFLKEFKQYAGEKESKDKEDKKIKLSISSKSI